MNTDESKELQSLRESVQTYHALVDCSQLGVAIFKNNIIFFANEAFARMGNFSVDDITGRSLDDLLGMVSSEHHDLLKSRHIDRLAGKPVPSRYEFSFELKNGRKVWVEMLANLIELSGEPAVLTTFIDITDRVRNEQALRQSEKRLAQIILGTSVPTFVIDNTHTVTHWNRACEMLTSIASSKIIGTNEQWRAFYPSPRPVMADLILDRAGEADLIKYYSGRYRPSVLIQGAYEAEDFFPAAGVAGKWLAFTASPLTDDYGSVIGAIETLQDITQRKEYEHALKAGEERIRLMINSSPDGIVVINGEGDFIEANDAFAHMLGYDRGELLTMNSYNISPVKWHEVQRRFIFSVLMVDGHGTFEKEYKRKDGVIIPAMLNCWRIPGKDSRQNQFGAFVRDVSRERAIEAQLRQSQKMEAVGTLAAGIAHDFNNSLTAILMNTELLIDDPSITPTMRPLLEDIHSSGLRAKSLIEQILTFSRQTSSERIPISLIQIIEDSIKMLRVSLPPTITISQKYDATCGPVMADPSQIHQIIFNLFSNAIHAMHKSGGVISIELSRKHVAPAYDESSTTIPGFYNELTISDTGHGMDEKTAERVFEPFFTTKNTGEGSGMGLAVVHGIVTDYGGTIRVESKEGKGSSFRIILPEYDMPEKTGTSLPDKVTGGTERVMIVDDEKNIVKIAAHTLESLGYQVTAFDSSTDALAAFSATPDIFDVVITDYTMPTLAGTGLAEAILTIRPGIPIILISGNNVTIDKETVEKTGIRLLASKPFTRESLALVLRKALA